VQDTCKAQRRASPLTQRQVMQRLVLRAYALASLANHFLEEIVVAGTNHRRHGTLKE
jgi:hypothetical protein